MLTRSRNFKNWIASIRLTRTTRRRKTSQHAVTVDVLEARVLLSATASAGNTVAPPGFSAQTKARLAQLGVNVATNTNPNAKVYLDPSFRSTPSQTPNIPQTAESSGVVRLDEFRNDPRFANITGAGYSVVVIDTGIDLNHSFFGPDADGNGIADRIVYQYDFYGSNDADASDFDGHGSNVASIVGSSNGTYGGMAPGVNIIALKVFSDFGGGAFLADMEEAFQWVVNNQAAYNIVAVNMSIGSQNVQSYVNTGLNDEYAALAAMGVTTAIASGNSFYSFNSVQGVNWLSADPNVLSVGAVYDANIGGFFYGDGAIAFSTGPDEITAFSQRHATLSTIFAPGAAITGANWDGSLVTMHGTSQASPHVAGIAALMQQLAQQRLGRQLTFTEMRDLMRATATTINDGDDENDNVANTGLNFLRIDVYAMAQTIWAMGSGLPSIPPILNSFGPPITFTENAAPVLITNSITVADIDSPNFSTGRLTISITSGLQAGDVLAIRNQGTGANQIRVSGNSVFLGSFQLGTFSGGNGTPLEIVLTTSATPDRVVTLLRNITYRHSTDAPSTAPKTLQVKLTDGDGGVSDPVTKTINVIAINDIPIVSGLGTTVSYTEQAAPVKIATSAVVADIDSANLANGRLTVTLRMSDGAQSNDRLTIISQGYGAGQVAVSGTKVYYGGVLVGTMSGGVGVSSLVVTWNTSATPAAAQAVLRSVAFSNTGNAPGALRTVQVSLTDGDGGTSVLTAKQIAITNQVDAAVLGALGAALTYRENGAALLIGSTATVTHPDLVNFNGGKLTISIATGAHAGDRLAIKNSGTAANQINISNGRVFQGSQLLGTYTGGVGATPLVITFSTGVTSANVQTLLRNITYVNVSENPSTTARTIQVRVTDQRGVASNLVSRQVNVTALNDAPILGPFKGPIRYRTGSAPAVLNHDATVTDADSANFSGGRLTVRLSSGATSTDRLAIRNQGTGAGMIGVNGSLITYGGVVIGTQSGGTGLSALSIVFNANATPIAVQALMRNLTYANVSTSLPSSTRTITFTLTDGDGGLGASASVGVNVN